MGERGVRNAEVEGSNPFASTISPGVLITRRSLPPFAQLNASCQSESLGRLWLPMQCPKCRHENPEKALFCTRCHAPLHFTCPACRHVQDRGGKCDQCGVDFAKYAAMLVFQAREIAQGKRKHTGEKTSLAKQIILIPLTGGLSLLKYVFSRLRRG